MVDRILKVTQNIFGGIQIDKFEPSHVPIVVSTVDEKKTACRMLHFSTITGNCCSADNTRPPCTALWAICDNPYGLCYSDTNALMNEPSRSAPIRWTPTDPDSAHPCCLWWHARTCDDVRAAYRAARWCDRVQRAAPVGGISVYKINLSFIGIFFGIYCPYPIGF